MLYQMPLRRPSGIVIAISCSLIAIVLWVQFGSTTSAVASKFRPSTSSCIVDNISNNTLGFEKIFVVGLPERTDRRDGFVLSAALSNMDIELVDGVHGEAVPNKAIPAVGQHDRMPDPVIGCWRGHMNAIQEIIRRNISTALILEDDADWDIRLRRQLRDLAYSSHALTQPLQHSQSAYADTTFPASPDDSTILPSDLDFDQLPTTIHPKHSPYGDNWDFMWVGHCGMRFPSPSFKKIPKGRVNHKNDLTVPQRHYLKTVMGDDELKDQYPNHTRVVHHVQEGICSLGYAITQAGARNLLYSVGLNDVTDPYDILLRQFCEGSGGRRYNNCLTVQPSLFFHHRPAGSMAAESDISDHGEDFRDKAVTDVIRWSTRMNWDALLDGRTDFVDQYPDV